MKIINLKHREDLENNSKLSRTQTNFMKLIEELNKKNISKQIIETINEHIENLNSSLVSDKVFRKLLIKKQNKILRLLEKEYKLVVKNYYQNLWLIVGMTSIGLPMGLAFGLGFDNMGLLASGLPIGMAIGLAIGVTMDKKASKEGRQLNL